MSARWTGGPDEQREPTAGAKIAAAFALAAVATVGLALVLLVATLVGR